MSGIVIATAVVFAHEGHRPLPTRGMEVNPETGRMVLTKSARTTLDVQTVEVGPRDVTPELVAYGSVVAPWDRHALVSSPLSGRIVELLVTPGESVIEGQVLAMLASPELDLLELEIRNAQTSLNLAIKLLNSAEATAQSGSIPEIRLVELKNQVKMNRVAVEIARAKWLGLSLPADDLEAILKSPDEPRPQKLSLRSPIAGVVTHSDLSVGKVINAKEHLFEVLDLSEVWLRIGVLEKDLSRIRVGQTLHLRLTAWPDQTFEARVDALGQLLDPQTHLGTAWATFSNPLPSGPWLLPGMSGEVRVKLGDSTEKLAVPLSAVIRDGAERFVLVEQEQTQVASTYQKQSVALGQRMGEYVEVRSGNLFPGDRVVTQGSHQLGGFFTKGVLKISDETANDIGLELQPVAAMSVADTLTVDGIIDVPPTRRTVASAQLRGAVAGILVDRGQRVHSGQVIAEIVSPEFQSLQLDLLRAHLDVELQQEVMKNLGGARDAVSQRRLWEAEAQLQLAGGLRESLRQRLLTTGLTQEQLKSLEENRELVPTLPLLASIDGVVMDFDKVLGHIVEPDEPVFEIHDLSEVWVQGFVSERDLARVQVGQVVRIRFISDEAEVVTGTVARSSRAIGRDDRTMSVWIEPESSPRFAVQHNMMARLTIETGRMPERLAVPRSAIVREGTRSYVFVRHGDGTFERRLVELGVTDDIAVEILHGLSAGELIAVRGTSALQTGYAALK